MNRKEFIKKFSLLSAGLISIPTLYSQEKSQNNVTGLVKDPKGILDLPPGFFYKIISKEKQVMVDA